MVEFNVSSSTCGALRLTPPRRRRCRPGRRLLPEPRLPGAGGFLLGEPSSLFLGLADRGSFLLFGFPLLDPVLDLQQTEHAKHERSHKGHQVAHPALLLLDVVSLEHGHELCGQGAGHLLELFVAPPQLIRGQRLHVTLLSDLRERLHVDPDEVDLLVLRRFGQGGHVRLHALAGGAPARDELDEDQSVVARLLENLGVLFHGVAVHDPAEGHHFTGASRAPPDRHLLRCGASLKICDRSV
mmetsp:Transcript_4961/g.22216  ORF Transcript_4961/g.22216 Transcript_4961/m.22216 type:complete len:241 (+) Transcript_4961:20-742(+)